MRKSVLLSLCTHAVAAVRPQEAVGDVGHLLGIVEGIQRAEIQRLQRVQLQIVPGDVGAVVERHVRAVDVRRAGAHGDRRVLGHMVTAADEPWRVMVSLKKRLPSLPKMGQIPPKGKDGRLLMPAA